MKVPSVQYLAKHGIERCGSKAKKPTQNKIYYQVLTESAMLALLHHVQQVRLTEHTHLSPGSSRSHLRLEMARRGTLEEEEQEARFVILDLAGGEPSSTVGDTKATSHINLSRMPIINDLQVYQKRGEMPRGQKVGYISLPRATADWCRPRNASKSFHHNQMVWVASFS
jgi:hypothetical protein